MMCFGLPLGRCFKVSSGCLLLGNDVLCEQGGGHSSSCVPDG